MRRQNDGAFLLFQDVRAAFRKTNARPFLVSGVLLLLMSLFTFFPGYYLIAGAALVLVSLAVRLFGHSAA